MILAMIPVLKITRVFAMLSCTSSTVACSDPTTPDAITSFDAPTGLTALHLACRHEAAYKLTGNSEAVARFACRGAGRGSGWSLLPGRAPLSDPNAEPNLDIVQDVDYCLRRVSFGAPLAQCFPKPYCSEQSEDTCFYHSYAFSM